MSVADATAAAERTSVVRTAKAVVTRPAFISWLALAFMTTNYAALAGARS